ncbi:MAG: c-type cytochrome [Bacteroidetes bacterium]|nr:c-type cytochrome [Bacteroidota bacterium]
MSKQFLLAAFIVILLVAFRSREKPLFVAPPSWPQPHYDFNENPLTASKIALGRVLFYDPILSADSSTSCSSCHSSYTAFAHTDHALSHGIHDSIGTRNAPALMNLAWKKSLMWDGAVHHLDLQALAPIAHPAEMGEELQHLTRKLQSTGMYNVLFKNAFGDTLVTGERTLKAIAQFMLVLVSAQSKYDSVMQGKTQFTLQEEKGYRLYQQHCSGCHAEPLFTNDEFAYNGLPADPKLNDSGRMKITGDPKDSLHFKVPTLRNIEVSYPYMHDGRFMNLTAVLKHYSTSASALPLNNPKLSLPLPLTPADRVDLLAFLLTLTDKNFLFNPDFAYPKKIIEQATKESERFRK